MKIDLCINYEVEYSSMQYNRRLIYTCKYFQAY